MKNVIHKTFVNVYIDLVILYAFQTLFDFFLGKNTPSHKLSEPPVDSEIKSLINRQNNLNSFTIICDE